MDNNFVRIRRNTSQVWSPQDSADSPYLITDTSTDHEYSSVYSHTDNEGDYGMQPTKA